jgi:hypothetical protein
VPAPVYLAAEAQEVNYVRAGDQSENGQALGLTIPRSILTPADEIIQ